MAFWAGSQFPLAIEELGDFSWTPANRGLAFASKDAKCACYRILMGLKIEAK